MTSEASNSRVERASASYDKELFSVIAVLTSVVAQKDKKGKTSGVCESHDL